MPDVKGMTSMAVSMLKMMQISVFHGKLTPLPQVYSQLSSLWRLERLTTDLKQERQLSLKH